MDKLKSGKPNNRAEQPSPTDFDRFVPWACAQLSVEVTVSVVRTVQSQYVSAVINRTKSKAKVPKAAPPEPAPSETISETSSSSSIAPAGLVLIQSIKGNDTPIIIKAIYDVYLNLVQLKFLKNKPIPRRVLQIIGFIIPYHKHLSSITINSGLDKRGIYEISNFLPFSRITEICLDNTFLAEANYHILLGDNNVKYISLSKCKINDAVVKTIASQLAYPQPASKMLSILNLATNRITDLGATYLADALRTNRRLSYLSLADNMVTDKGAISILNTLVEFPITDAEVFGRNERLMTYLKEKNILIEKMLKNLHATDLDKKARLKKIVKPAISLKKSKTIESSVEAKSFPNMEMFHSERAVILAESILGPFDDPFSLDNTERRDNILYCCGNYTLCYLNVAYNDLTYISVRKLYEVLLAQKLISRQPRGLINVMIEGNYLPNDCEELQLINDLIESGLGSIRKLSDPKKKTPSSRSSRY